MTTSIQSGLEQIAKEVFTDAVATLDTAKDCLNLVFEPTSTNSIYEPISYERKIDDIVLNSLLQSHQRRNHELRGAKDLRVAFRSYQLKIYKKNVLEQKITEIVNNLIAANTPNAIVVNPQQADEALLMEVEKQFEAGKTATLTNYSNIVPFIGHTGAGKSTEINHLYGCKMQSIDSTLLGKPGARQGKQIIIAEYGIAEIGHSMGVNSSQTKHPQFVEVTGEDLMLCDCPGFDENRGSATEICNALLIVDVLERATSLGGFVFFCSYNSFNIRANEVVKNFKYLQLLLQDFTKYQNHVLFVVTQTEPGVTKVSLKKCFLEILESIVYESRDYALADFCKQIYESDVLEHKLVIANPMDPNSRAEMLELIEGLQIQPMETIERNFGYPISSQALNELGNVNLAIQELARVTLASLKTHVAEHWKQKIQNSDSVEVAKECFDELQQNWPIAQKEFTLKYFVESGNYKDFTEIVKLRQSLTYSEKIKGLIPNRRDFIGIDTILKPSFTQIADLIKELIETAEKQYHAKVYEVTKTQLEDALQSYKIQQTVLSQKSLVEGKDLDDVLILVSVIDGLIKITETTLTYRNELQEILGKDSNKIKGLQEIIKKNILHPITIVRTDYAIEVKGHKIALSQALKEMDSSTLAGKKELVLTIKGEKESGKLYFDDDLLANNFAGKIVRINADTIEVMKRSSINLKLSWLHSGVILMTGLFKGKEETGSSLVLNPSNEEPTFRMISKSSMWE